MPPNLSASEMLTHSTVRIEVEASTGEKGTGTGFFYRFAEIEDKALLKNEWVKRHVG